MKSVAQPLRRVKAKMAAAIGTMSSMLRPSGSRASSGKPKASEYHPSKVLAPTLLALPPCRCVGPGGWSPSCHMHLLPIYSSVSAATVASSSDSLNM